MNADEMYEYVERVANLIRTSLRKTGLANGLQPVHMEALHYLSRCNRYSNTPVAVADFLGLTKGTVSQTLRVLESDGLLHKTADQQDRRVIRLTLTPDGQQVLAAAIPPPLLDAALAEMPEAEQQQLQQSIARLLRALQHANGLKTFGACKTCLHHRHGADDQRHCGLTQEVLSHADAELICREHLPAALGLGGLPPNSGS